MYHINKLIEGSGEYVNLKDTAEYRFKKLQIKGNSTQKTRSGKNICPTDFSEWVQGQYATSGGTDTFVARVRLKDLLPIIPSATYYLHTHHSQIAFVLREYDSTGTFIKSIGGVTNGKTIQASANAGFWGVTLYNATDNTGTYENYKTLFEDSSIKPFICLDSETDKTFEQYGQMPSPDFPSEIETVGDNENLLDLSSNHGTTVKNGVTITIDKDKGSVTYNGTCTTAFVFSISLKETLQIGTTISMGTFNANTSNDNGTAMRLWSTEDAKAYSSFGMHIKENKVENYTTVGKIATVQFRLQLNNTYENFTFYPKLVLGSKLGAFSLYGMGSTGVKVGNKNFFTFDNMATKSGTQVGVDYEYNKNNLKLNGTTTGTGQIAYIQENKLFTVPKGKYTITINKKGITTYGTADAQFTIMKNARTTANGGERLLAVSKSSTENKVTVEFDKETHIFWSNYCNGAGVIFDNVTVEVQIEKGEVSTEIIEHQSQSLPIYLDGKYCKIGDFQDYLYKDLDEGKWYKHKEIREAIITGSNVEWTMETSANFGSGKRFSCWLKDTNPAKSRTICMSNMFKGTTESINDEGICFIFGSRLYIYPPANITSIDELNTFLAENNLRVHLPLETPIEEEITDPVLIEQYDKLLKLQAYKGETNIYNTDIAILDVAAYKQITDEFIENIINGKPTRGYIKVLANNQYPEIIINENNYLKDFKIEDLRYVPEEGFIGGTVCKRVTVNFNNVDNNFTIQDREFELYLGVDFEDGSTEYIKYGTFIVQKPSDDRVTDNTYFEALDYMCKFNQPYVDRITYPCTLKDLFYDVVSQATLETTVDSFANDDFIVENNQFESGATLRDVLKAIAQIAFTWARVDEENYVQLDFEQKEEISEELDENQYYNLETSKEYGPVNTIVIRNSQIEGENVTIKNQKLIDAPAGNQLVDFGNPTYTTNADYTFENDILTVFSTNKTDITYNQIQYNITDLCKANRGKTLYFNYESMDLSKYTSTNSSIAILVLQIDGTYQYLTMVSIAGTKTARLIPTEGEITRAYLNIFCNNTSSTGVDSTVVITKPMLSFVENATYEPYIATGPIELVINDNPFAYTQEKRQQLITAGEKMYGLTYTPMKMNMIGMFYLNSKDKIRVKTLNNQYYETYLLDHTIDYTGTVSDSMESQAKTKTETQYKYTPPLEQQLKHTEVKVDKANQKIQAIIENQTSTNTQVTELNLELGKISASVATKDEVTNQINELQINVENTINKVTTSGGNNIFYTAKEYWHGETEESSASLEVITDTDIKQNTTSGLAYDLNNGVSIQKQTVKNDAYTISFIYNKKLASSTAYVLINNERYDLITSTVNKWNNFVAQVNIDTNSIEIEFVCDSNNGFYVADLMVNIGSEKMVWSQNANETITDTVIIGRGIQVNSSNTKTYTRMDADGNRTFNSLTNERVGEMTSKGIYGNELEVKGQAKVNALLIQKVDNQVWLTGL